LSLVRLGSPANVPVTHGSIYAQHPQQRPEIEVEVAATSDQGLLLGRPVRTTVLVDSGADVTMLDGGLARTLGIDLDDPKYPKTTVGGVGQGGVPVARVVVRMQLCDRWRSVPVNFTRQPIHHPQLLGREGAFDALLVSFLHQRFVLLASAA
jgi:Aspartyl protease